MPATGARYRRAHARTCAAVAAARGCSSPAGSTIADAVAPGSQTTRLPVGAISFSSCARSSNATPDACASSANASRDATSDSSPAGTFGHSTAICSANRCASEEMSSGWNDSATAFGVKDHPQRTQRTGQSVVVGKGSAQSSPQSCCSSRDWISAIRSSRSRNRSSGMSGKRGRSRGESALMISWSRCSRRRASASRGSCS